MKKPIVELSDCSRCGVCIEDAPSVFQMTDAGFIIVAELELYPIEEVETVHP